MKQSKKFYIIVIANIIVTIVGMILLALGLNKEKNISKYSYEIQKSSDYEILLNENNFYENDILPSGYIYASKSIDEIMIDFKYYLKGNENTNIKYNYRIVGNLVGTVDYNNEQNKEIWNRSFVFYENSYNEEENINELLVDKNVNIKYGIYSDLVNSYEKEYDISVDSVLKIFLNISYEIDLSQFNVDNEIAKDVIEVDIPINNTVTEVKEKYEKSDFKEINSNENNYSIDKIICLTLGIALLSIEVIILAKKIEESIRRDLKQNYIKNILKNYNNLIVTVENEPDISNLKVMNVNKFEDLIDIAEQNQTNIIHYEVVKDKESKFYVIVNNYAYICELRNEK